MGLDIMKVHETAMPRPDGPAYRFAWSLAQRNWENNFLLFSDGNMMVEVTAEELGDLASEYCNANNLNAAERQQVTDWSRSVFSAPPESDRGVALLHLNW